MRELGVVVLTLLETVVTQLSVTATQLSTVGLTATLLSTVGVDSVLSCATGTADTLYWIVVPEGIVIVCCDILAVGVITVPRPTDC